MLHKERSWEVSCPHFVVPAGKTIGTSSTYPSGTHVCSENISWSGNDRNKSRPHFCNHCKDEYFGSVPSNRVQYSTYRFERKSDAQSPSGWVWKDTTQTSSESGFYWAGGSEKNTGSVSELDTRIGDACVALASACVKPMMDLPTAIVELRDIPKTIKALPDLVRFARRFPKMARPYVNTVKQVASSYLAYTFGVTPTVNDVKNFVGQVPDRIKLGVRQVKYKRGQPVRAGFRVESPDLGEYIKEGRTSYTEDYSIPMQQASVKTDCPFITIGANSTTVAGRGVVATPNWPYYQYRRVIGNEVSGCVFGRVANDFAADISALDDLKMNSDPLLTAWEILPFSFVVDWFANIGKWLNQANRLTAARKLGFRLEDGIWLSKRVDSVVYTAACESTFSGSASGNDSATAIIGHGSCTKRIWFALTSRTRVYERYKYREFVRLPTLQIRGLGSQGAFQWGTGTALAIQQCMAGL